MTAKLKKALEAALVGLAFGQGRVVEHDVSTWASITFSGTRHLLTMEFIGPEAVAGCEAMLEALPDHEFALPGHLVADAFTKNVDHRFGQQERMTAVLSLLCLKDIAA